MSDRSAEFRQKYNQLVRAKAEAEMEFDKVKAQSSSEYRKKIMDLFDEYDGTNGVNFEE